MTVRSPERRPLSPASPSSVEVRGWGWRYAGRRSWACRDVDLHIEPGQRVLLLGPSGGGKSTLLQGVAGLLDPENAAEQHGSIQLDGRPAEQARDRVGMLFQDPEASLVMARSGDDVAFGLENAGVRRDQVWPRVDQALAAVGFPYGRDRSTAALSGGEQQRLALAGALVREPSVLVLDEPTANLDPEGTDLVLGAVDRVLRATDATLLMVEHHVTAAVPLVDRVVILHPGGGIVDDGSPAEVFGRRGAELSEAGVWVPHPWGPPAPPPRRGTAAGPVVASGRDLTLAYPGARSPALADAHLDLRHGEAVVATGPNGSGKSTLAMLMAGLLAPDRGAVRMTTDTTDQPLHQWPARRLCRHVGTVFQDPEHQFLTPRVDTELLLGPKRAGMPEPESRSRCAELLQRLRLDHLREANPFTLSGGEKRRLSVATALATAPDLVVLDEPTFGQDALTWRELVDLCADVRDDGTAVLAVTHDTTFATAFADRAVEVRAGRLL